MPRRETDTSHLLPFQQYLLAQFDPPEDVEEAGPSSSGNLLLILARGLGLRSVIASLLKSYDSPDQLVLVVNALPEEEKGLSEEVGMRMKVVGYEMAAPAREQLYKSGGLLSVTSRILVVDMLTQKIPVDLITGIVVLHAETVSPTSLEAFIVRIYRNSNKTGFIKAFSDQPEAFTIGFAPLQTVLQQLKIREVMLWPRFHEFVEMDLRKRKADVIELYQPMTDNMRDIQAAVIECMEATLSEIKRSNTSLDVEDLTVENALFRSFDVLVRSQLDTVWHKVGPKTRQLVSDLTMLRNLQVYLLSFDCVSFNRFLETILSSQNTTPSGMQKENRSPWLFTAAADTIFTVARKRVYEQKQVVSSSAQIGSEKGNGASHNLEEEPPEDLSEEDYHAAQGGPTEDEEAMLREMDESVFQLDSSTTTVENSKSRVKVEETPRAKPKPRVRFLPPGVEPVLEEQPKWQLLAELLDEIEEELHWAPVDIYNESNNTILVMCGSTDTCSTLGDYLISTMEENGGQQLLSSKLESYFFWKASVGKMQRNLRRQGKFSKLNAGAAAATSTPSMAPGNRPAVSAADANQYENAALKRKAEYRRGQAPSTKRRRVRGGGAVGATTTTETDRKLFAPSTGANPDALESEAGVIADIFDASSLSTSSAILSTISNSEETFSDVDFENYFGLLSNEDLVIIRPYTGDDDDRVLEELRPKHVIMYDPDPAFVRRLESYRAAQGDLDIKLHFLMYKDSVEEQRYLSSIRKEKDAFEKLIREKGQMAIPHEAEYRPGEDVEEMSHLRTVSTRQGGGAKQARQEKPRVIVDVREFRSSLPSLLHAGHLEVVPLTIGVGDYVITPEICVERKSIPDLISSFNSGRLYQQCELMTAYYKQPLLLIEFDEKKSFNLETYAQTRAKGSELTSDFDIRSKLVLLTISFPRLRIIWSSSPYQTVDIIRELKENRDEPNPEKAVLIGADEASGGEAAEGTGEAGFNAAPQEILRNLPGINTKNYRYVMSKVESVEQLCTLELKEVQALIGNEAGKLLYQFIHNDLTVKA